MSGQALQGEVKMLDIGCSETSVGGLEIEATGDDGRDYQVALRKTRHFHIPVGFGLQ